MQKKILEVERSLLAGVLSDRLWNEALMRVADLAGASYLGIMTRDEGTGQFHVTEPVKLSQRLLDDYEAEFRESNPMNGRKVLSQDGETYLDWDVLGRGFIKHSPFFQDFMRPHGLAHMMGHRVDSCDGQAHYLSVHRLVNEAAFEAKDAEAISLVHSALRHTLTLRQRLRGLQQTQAWQKAALDALSFPIMLVNARATVLRANHAAEAWLSAPECPLSVTGASRERQELSGIIRQALGQPGARARSASLRLSFDARYAGTVCVAIPVVEDGEQGLGVRHEAALLMVWPATPKAPGQQLLRQAFGLSLTETRVASLFAQGHTPQEIADLRSVSESTVRSHIKSIFQKTHVRRQYELARLLAGLGIVSLDE